MKISKVLKKPTALNLEIRGSIGTFQVGQPGGEKSIEVRYLTSHVGFDATGDSNNLLSHIAPVREIFDFNDLDFSEIMQRDIDDARVTKDMIPYLLDPKNRGLVKFFPPIVVAIAAVDKNEAKPSKHYPKVSRTQEPHPEGYVQDVVQSGEHGSEVFRFECPLEGDDLCLHDGARLKLNTSKSRLIILDGQHRAMALLALHRNLKNQWSDAKRAPYENYYAQWTRQSIEDFDLSALRLPVIICAFPDVDSSYTGELDITRAIRAMFLTLNKTARKVSNSRNVMLDDSDLIAHFTRVLLSDVKHVAGDASHSLRIWNIELDQVEDRVQITSPAAMSGVTHAYYAIEHLLLNHTKVKDIAPRTGKFKSIKTNIEATLLTRLNAVDILGNAESSKMRRDSYRESHAEKLEGVFRERYAAHVLQVWRMFSPFASHCRATYNVYSSLSGNVNSQVRPILFDGQSTGRNFEEYLAFVKERAADAKKVKQNTPFQDQHLASLNGTKSAVEDQVKIMHKQRAELFIDGVANKADLRTNGELDPKVLKVINLMYQNVFTTVAFQAAVVCGFFHVIESVERVKESQGQEPPSRHDTILEYLECLNKYFRPSSVPQFRNLLKVFTNCSGTGAASTWTDGGEPLFRTVVYGGEMKPDEWPKYRYIGLELWEPSDEAMKAEVLSERDACREAVFKALYKRKANDYVLTVENSKRDLTPAEEKAILIKTLSLHNELIDALGKGKNKIELSQARLWMETPAEVEPESAEDGGGD